MSRNRSTTDQRHAARPGETRRRAGGRPAVELIGWDIGGVNLKAAAIADGRVVAAAETSYQIRRGLGVVSEALATLPSWAQTPARHAITMTAELSAIFEDRRSGVLALCAWASEHLVGPVGIYGGQAGFLDVSRAPDHAVDVASANWHATAAFLAKRLPDAILVDIGSTTADIVPIEAGRVAALGYRDAERLATGELVYSGAIRTPLMALAEKAPFDGGEVSFVAEHFCTTADAYRLTGLLPASLDHHEAADGRDKSLAASRARLARLIGRDAADAPDYAWDDLAAHMAELQLRRLHDALARVLSRRRMPARPPIIGCGIGRFIAERLAKRAGLHYHDFAECVPVSRGCRHQASTYAPAVAVACLAAGL